MPVGGVKVEGLREFNRALRHADRELQRRLVDGLKDAGDPVRRRAEQLALREISNIGSGGWHEMKVGTRTAVAYVAPRRRRRRGSPRPSFGGLLMREAMIPALEQEEREVVRRVDGLLDEIAADFNR